MKKIATILAALSCLLAISVCPVLAQPKAEGVRLVDEGEALEKGARTKEDFEKALGKFEKALIISIVSRFLYC
jgi:hypothetical protein